MLVIVKFVADGSVAVVHHSCWNQDNKVKRVTTTSKRLVKTMSDGLPYFPCQEVCSEGA